ncbi:MAG: M18 family aminopeptidase [Parachlamydiaceae bacterium]|nr:M18 family aminopeptidase [Parachlamydiaceae bacterium]
MTDIDQNNLSDRKEIIELLKFIKSSPTAYHAGASAVELCVAQNGFTELRENRLWKITSGEKYFIARDSSSFIALIMPISKPRSVCILGAHTDSPGLKLKPMPTKAVDNAILLSPEVYGSPITPSWMGRKLGIAGQITYLDGFGKCQTSLIDLGKTVGRIPYVAISLERTQKDKIEINFQDHLPVLCGLLAEEPFNLEAELKKIIPFSKLLSHDLFFVPTELPEIVNDQFIFSPRLDNLLGAHACLFSLLESQQPEETQIKMVVCWDHEEVGSDSYKGAGSNFLESVLNRICDNSELSPQEIAMLKANSSLISVDVAHGRHPNYIGKHEANHSPLLGMGPVIKHHANQSYATDSKSASWIQLAGIRSGVPIQNFVIRSDTLCGSTIGNIAAPRLGIPAVDIGAPILEMHAIEETGSLLDHVYMCKLLKTLLTSEFTT